MSSVVQFRQPCRQQQGQMQGNCCSCHKVSGHSLTGRGEGLAPGPQGVEHRLVLVPGEQDRRVRLRGAVVAVAAAAAASVRPSGRDVSGRHPHEIRLFGAGVGGVRPGADSEVSCSREIHLILVIRVMWHFSELTVTH